MLQIIAEGDNPAAAFHLRLNRAIDETMSNLVPDYNPAAYRLDMRIHATTSYMNRKVFKKLHRVGGQSENFSVHFMKTLTLPGAWTVQQRISSELRNSLWW
jgi:hypothetical protein